MASGCEVDLYSQDSSLNAIVHNIFDVFNSTVKSIDENRSTESLLIIFKEHIRKCKLYLQKEQITCNEFHQFVMWALRGYMYRHQHQLQNFYDILADFYVTLLAYGLKENDHEYRDMFLFEYEGMVFKIWPKNPAMLPLMKLCRDLIPQEDYRHQQKRREWYNVIIQKSHGTGWNYTLDRELQEALEKKKEDITHIQEFLAQTDNPRSLQALCRLEIHKQLKKRSPKIPVVVQELPLPAAIKSYLALNVELEKE